MLSVTSLAVAPRHVTIATIRRLIPLLLVLIARRLIEQFKHTMGFLSPLIGGGVGVGVQMYANAVQKVPLSRCKSTFLFFFFLFFL